MYVCISCRLFTEEFVCYELRSSRGIERVFYQALFLLSAVQCVNSKQFTVVNYKTVNKRRSRIDAVFSRIWEIMRDCPRYKPQEIRPSRSTSSHAFLKLLTSCSTEFPKPIQEYTWWYTSWLGAKVDTTLVSFLYVMLMQCIYLCIESLDFELNHKSITQNARVRIYIP